MTREKPVCKHPDCKAPPAPGCFVIDPKGKPPFAVALFCADHGKAAIKRGARHMTYRPKFLMKKED